VDADGLKRAKVYRVLLTIVLHNLRGLEGDHAMGRLKFAKAIPVFLERYESDLKAWVNGVPEGTELTLLSDIRFMTDNAPLKIDELRHHKVFEGILQSETDLFVHNEDNDQVVHKDYSSGAAVSPEDALLIVQNGFHSRDGAAALLIKNRVVWKDLLYDAVVDVLSGKGKGSDNSSGTELELERWADSLLRAGLFVQPTDDEDNSNEEDADADGVDGRLMYSRSTMHRVPDSTGGGFQWSLVPMVDVEVSGKTAGNRKPLVVSVVPHSKIKSTLNQLYCCRRPNGVAPREDKDRKWRWATTTQRGEGVAVGMGINKMEGYVHSLYWGISRRRIAQFLNNKEERQICRALRAPSTLRHLPPVYRMNDKWQLDSAKMGSTHRWWPTFRNSTPDRHAKSPYRGYVAAIDVFTRYAWILPVQTKASSENDSIKCFEDALTWCEGVYNNNQSRGAEPKHRTLGGVAHRPKVVQSDNGSEFGLAGGKIRTVVDGQMLSSWLFAEYETPERRGTLSRFQQVLQTNLIERYDTVRPAAPQQQAYIEVFNKTFKKNLRDMILAGGIHHRTLRGNPSKQLELMVRACAKYNDSPHNSMPPHLTPHKLVLCMMTQGVPGLEPWKTAEEVVEFRKAHYIGHSEKKRKTSKADIDVGAFVRVALGEGRDYFDNDSTWQQKQSARENYTDRQAQKTGLRKALGSNYSTQIYRVVGRRAPHKMSALQYYIAPITLADLKQFGQSSLPSIAPGEHIMKRHIGFYAEHLQEVDVANLEPMVKCSLRGVVGENYGAKGTDCNPVNIADKTHEEDRDEPEVVDDDDGNGDDDGDGDDSNDDGDGDDSDNGSDDPPAPKTRAKAWAEKAPERQEAAHNALMGVPTQVAAPPVAAPPVAAPPVAAPPVAAPPVGVPPVPANTKKKTKPQPSGSRRSSRIRAAKEGEGP
jgi:hypothetical protein